MKSLIVLTLISALLGLGLGIGLAYVEVPTALDAPFLPEKEEQPPTGEELAKSPRIELPETVFKFGNIERGTTMSHEFVVRNVGEVPLRVEVASTTCKCTVGDLEKNEILPGEESVVLLEWHAKTAPSPFRHGAVLRTTDPTQSSIDLIVEGQVVESTAMSPSELIFGTVQSGKTAEASLYLMSFLDEEIRVTDYQLSDKALAENIEITIIPAERAELPSPDATNGVKVTAKFKSGKTVGPFRNWLTLTTNLERAKTLEVRLAGQVVGEVSINAGGGGAVWNKSKGVLRLGSFASAEGKKAKLTLAVRGEYGEELKWEVVEVDPACLQVSVGKSKPLGPKRLHFPIQIEIPSGTAPVVRLGEPISSDAHIVLRSNNEKIPDVRMRVHFAVE